MSDSMWRYTQLTYEKRYQTQALLKAVHIQTEIADILSVNKSTISWEIKPNTGNWGYRHKQAHEHCLPGRQHKGKAHIVTSTWYLIKKMLCEDWSHEQTSGILKCDFNFFTSPEWIYQNIYKNKVNGVSLHQDLRFKKEP